MFNTRNSWWTMKKTYFVNYLTQQNTYPNELFWIRFLHQGFQDFFASFRSSNYSLRKFHNVSISKQARLFLHHYFLSRYEHFDFEYPNRKTFSSSFKKWNKHLLFLSLSNCFQVFVKQFIDALLNWKYKTPNKERIKQATLQTSRHQGKIFPNYIMS